MATDPDNRSHPAACKSGHRRAGIVTNQDPDEPYNRYDPHMSMAVCAREECIAKAIKKVAGGTNRQATFYSDEERRADRG